MEVLFFFLFFAWIIFVIVGLINPQLVIRWGNKKNRIQVALIGIMFFVFLMIFAAVLQKDNLKIQANIKQNESTILDKVTFDGVCPDGAELKINSEKISINNGKFSKEFPLKLGDNQFEIIYKYKEIKENQEFIFNRISEKELEEEAKKEQLKEKEKELELKEKEEIANGKVTASMFGDQWALTVNEGKFECESLGNKLAKLYFIDKKGTKYAVNGMAKNDKTYKPIDLIWKANPDVKGLKMDIGPLIDYGLKFCK